jgi:hypothetical protein
MGVNYKGSQGQTERAVVLQEGKQQLAWGTYTLMGEQY